MTDDSKPLVIDADAHVVESERTWEFMDPGDKKYRPMPLKTENTGAGARQFWLIDGKVRGFRFPSFTREQLAARKEQTGRRFADDDDAREMGNVELRLEAMDAAGVDVEVLHNTMFIEPAADHTATEVALYRCWNRWLADIWQRGRGRLRWSCMAPTMSISDALDEIRVSHEHGACAVLMRPVEGNRLLADEYFYPIYQLASDLDIPIAVHIANGSAWLNELYNHPRRGAATLHRFRVPTVAAFNDIFLSEVPQVFPRLRWGFIEASAQWLPWVLHEAKHRWRDTGRPWPASIGRDSGMYVTCENSDDLPYIIGQADADCLVIGTDYGHTDVSSDVDAIKTFRARADLTDEQKRKILTDNPRALYGL